MDLLNLEGLWQNILATFVENGNINIRDELRDLGQQPNLKKKNVKIVRGLVGKISLDESALCV